MKPRQIAIDIHDLAEGLILDSLLQRGGEVFRTSRRRKAILIGEAAIADLKRQYSLNIEEGLDGTGVIKG